MAAALGVRLLSRIAKANKIRFDGSVLSAEVITPSWNTKALIKKKICCNGSGFKKRYYFC